jgi:hypothetical protein
MKELTKREEHVATMQNIILEVKMTNGQWKLVEKVEDEARWTDQNVEYLELCGKKLVGDTWRVRVTDQY